MTIGLLVAFAACGVWISYHYFRWQWHLEGDIAGPYLVWRQVLRDGIGALTTWRYAQDNWLFSLTIPDFAVLAATGGSAWAIFCQGWVFFLLNALASYLLLATIVPRVAAATTAAAMLFAGPAVLGGMIYLTYPVSHNISLVWGLYGLLCLVRYTRAGRAVWLGLGAAALFVGTSSDPWLGASLDLPIVVAAVVAAAFGRERRGRMVAVAFCAAMVFALARLRLLGLLWFLPGSDFKLGDPAQWWSHLGWLVTYATVMFNAVPRPQPAFDWLPPVWLVAVNCGLLAAMAGWSIWLVWRDWRILRIEARLLAVTAIVGCGAIGTAFTVSDVHAIPNVGRYVASWFYLVPLLVVTAGFASPDRRDRWFQRAAAGWCALLVVSGIAAIPSQQMSLPADFATPDTRALIEFLRENDLTYGYAPFWGTNGAAPGWLSGGKLIIRPVSLSSAGRITPWNAQTDPSWYESRDIPEGQKAFFLLAAPDPDLCPDVATCEALARRDFGPPQRVLHFRDIPVLVWDHPIMTGFPDSDLIGAAPVLVPGQPVKFTTDGAGGALEWRGWSGVEATAAWTEARQAVLMIHLPDDWSGPATLTFTASGFPTREKRGPQPVTVSVDGAVLATWTVAVGRTGSYDVTIPADIAARKRLALVLDLPGASRPSDFRYVYDVRSLAMYLQSMTLRSQ